jgi:nicotinamide phosphoribosyltransferase
MGENRADDSNTRDRSSGMTPRTNLLLNTDSYKPSHFLQYPPGAEVVYSYIEARRGLGPGQPETVFFGLQMFLKEYLSQPITAEDIDEAEMLLTAHGEPFNRAGWDHILNRRGGLMPVEIQAAPEGLVLPPRNVLIQAHNTDETVPWLTSYLETALLRAIWYPTTVATTSWHIKQIIRRFLNETADDPEAALPFKLHDFGARGASSAESAAIGALAHLVNFQGSDTLGGVVAARRYYQEPMAAFSIPAAEHSTITSWGPEREADAFANMVTRFSRPGSLYAVVSDSYDIMRAVTDLWGGKLKDKVLEGGGTLVVRPDSGDPVETVAEVMKRLIAAFGGGPNGKGYWLLPPAIRVIQGDGVDAHSIAAILTRLRDEKISAENIAFGMGGALLQGVTRDTLGFAMKASAIRISGMWHDIWKSPAGDSSKASKRGRLALMRTEEGIRTVPIQACPVEANLLRPVFRDGRILVQDNLATIRKRANIGAGERFSV